MRIPVVIDTDPGLDDALALMVAFASEELDIKLISTVAGNQTVEKTTRNAAKILELGKQDIKLVKGASRPLMREPVYADDVHGDSGIGSVNLKEPNYPISLNAYKEIYDVAVQNKGELEIIALGPLTNIANTILLYPDLKDYVKRIVLMGGGYAFGNTTPAAEFNIYADAEAAKVVFESDIPLVMVGLDATHEAYVLEEEIDGLFTGENKTISTLKQLMMDLVDVSKRFKFGNAHMHDLLAVVATYKPEVVEGDYHRVDIETRGKVTYGKTVVDKYHVSQKSRNVYVTWHTDRAAFLNLLRDKFGYFNQECFNE